MSKENNSICKDPYKHLDLSALSKINREFLYSCKNVSPEDVEIIYSSGYSSFTKFSLLVCCERGMNSKQLRFCTEELEDEEQILQVAEHISSGKSLTTLKIPKIKKLNWKEKIQLINREKNNTRH